MRAAELLQGPAGPAAEGKGFGERGGDRALKERRREGRENGQASTSTGSGESHVDTERLRKAEEPEAGIGGTNFGDSTRVWALAQRD